MKVPVEIRPISAGPYPLVPNEGPYVAHEHFECGDPEWCLHEPVPDEDDIGYELIPMRVPERPAVFGLQSPPALNPDLAELLIQAGLPAMQANRLAIVFHETMPEHVTMMPNGELMGVIGYVGNESSYFDLKSCPEGVYYPVSVHLLAGMSPERTNSTFWHEVGHLVRRAQQTEVVNHVAYRDEQALRRTKRLGRLVMAVGSGGCIADTTLSSADMLPSVVAGPVGAVSVLVGMSGFIAMTQPAQTRWLLSREERFCDRFAKRYKADPALMF